MDGPRPRLSVLGQESPHLPSPTNQTLILKRLIATMKVISRLLIKVKEVEEIITTTKL